MTGDERRAEPDPRVRTSFSSLYQQYSGRGLRYAAALLRNESDAEEAVQEAFCRLLGPLGMGRIPLGSTSGSNGVNGVGEAQLDQDGFAAAYFRILRNHSIDLLRRRRHRDHLPIDAVPEPLAPPGPVDGDRGQRLQRQVAEALADLPARQREALELRIHGRLSYDEIGRILDCTHAQVRSFIYRARRQLSRVLRPGSLHPKRGQL